MAAATTIAALSLAAISTGAGIEQAQHQKRLAGQELDRQNAAQDEARRKQRDSERMQKQDETNAAARASLLQSQRRGTASVQGRQGQIMGGKSKLGA